MRSQHEVMDSPSAEGSTELIACAERAASALVGSRPPESASACMAEVERLGRIVEQLETAMCSRVRRVDAAGEVRAWGYPSTAAWLRTRLGTRHTRAVERVTLARQLPRLPMVAKRLVAGELSHGYASAIASGVKYLDDRDVGAAEHILLDLVDDGASLSELTKTCARITDLISDRDPRSPSGRNRRSWLAVTTDQDGRGAHVSGWLSATHASMLRQACAPLAVPAGADDDRDHPQRFADALYTHLSGGGRRWDATIVIDATTLAPGLPTGGQPGPADPAGTAPVSQALWPARTPDGLVISAEQARKIALNAGLSTLVVGSHGLPLYLGRKTRLVTPAQRKALTALYDSCVADGCIIPAYLCQIDHVRSWTLEGPTDIDNLAPECAFHNRFKSDHPDRVDLIRRNGRWKYRFRHPTRRPSARSANGRNPSRPP